MRIGIITLGCKANQYDSACMEESARLRGWDIVRPASGADVVIVNTCTVTRRADMQCRQLLRRLRRVDERAVLIATGCYARVDPGGLARVGGIDAVVADRRSAVASGLVEELVARRREGRPGPCRRAGPPGGPCEGACDEGWPFDGPAVALQRTRAFFKIQDGCDMTCSFCIIPRARGRSRSLPPETVIRGVDRYRDMGVAEVVLTGIHLGAYGRDLVPRSGLTDLLREVSSRCRGIRIRVSSLDPQEVSDELLDVMSSSGSICRHVHIALQSGDPSVLRAMRRPSSADRFAEAVLSARERMPDACIGADVIAGFPGESEGGWRKTVRLLESLPVSYLHVFPYSRKQGTEADRRSDHVPPATIAARARALRALGTGKKMEFYRGFVGQVARVLVERTRDRKTGALTGYTSNYLRVIFHGPDHLMEKEVPVRLTGVEEGRIRGIRPSPASAGECTT